jgi:hypothetical protein
VLRPHRRPSPAVREHVEDSLARVGDHALGDRAEVLAPEGDGLSDAGAGLPASVLAVLGAAGLRAWPSLAWPPFALAGCGSSPRAGCRLANSSGGTCRRLHQPRPPRESRVKT